MCFFRDEIDACEKRCMCVGVCIVKRKHSEDPPSLQNVHVIDAKGTVACHMSHLYTFKDKMKDLVWVGSGILFLLLCETWVVQNSNTALTCLLTPYYQISLTASILVIISNHFVPNETKALPRRPVFDSLWDDSLGLGACDSNSSGHRPPEAGLGHSHDKGHFEKIENSHGSSKGNNELFITC